jgi:hypothetical protein
MADNLHESRDDVARDTGPKQHNDRIPRWLVRLIVGFLGSLFGFQALWIAISTLTEPDGRDRVFPILLFPSMITFALAAGWAALTTITVVRIAAWAVAGFGAGFLLDGILGCLDPGEVMGPSSIVLGLVFIVIGSRQNPSR